MLAAAAEADILGRKVLGITCDRVTVAAAPGPCKNCHVDRLVRTQASTRVHMVRWVLHGEGCVISVIAWRQAFRMADAAFSVLH